MSVKESLPQLPEIWNRHGGVAVRATDTPGKLMARGIRTGTEGAQLIFCCYKPLSQERGFCQGGGARAAREGAEEVKEPG